ncbi:MAG: ubiquinol-cytochrome c reductase iron-sulfur subunit [Pseudomonadota bacterium]
MSSDTSDTTRRDFLTMAGPVFLGIGTLATLWPFVDQMNPDATAVALASTEVDLSPIETGQAITVMWRGKPVFVRNRTEEEVQQARDTDVSDLPDPATDASRVKEEHSNWLVMVGICTHLGCIPKGQKLGDVKGEFGGWFCPCHGSHYDTSGRIRKGPAPTNLAVPDYEFLADDRIKIG